MPIKAEHQARYPADWREIRARVLERAGHRCEWCGAANGAPHPRTGSRVVLTIAHVYDPRPERVEPSNLAALCQRCHNRHDAWMRSHGHPLPPPGRGRVQVSLEEWPGGDGVAGAAAPAQARGSRPPWRRNTMDVSITEQKAQLWISGFDPGAQGWRALGPVDDQEVAETAEGLRVGGIAVETFVSPMGKLSYYARQASAEV